MEEHGVCETTLKIGFYFGCCYGCGFCLHCADSKGIESGTWCDFVTGIKVNMVNYCTTNIAMLKERESKKRSFDRYGFLNAKRALKCDISNSKRV